MPKPIILTKAEIKKFWTYVEKRGPNDCWRWLGCHKNVKNEEYPIYIPNSDTKYAAHRVACFLTYGDAGKCCCHKCPGGGNPWCVNPKHLYPGTDKTNSADRDRDGTTQRGETHSLAKLTQKQVVQIVKLRKKNLTYEQIAARIGCTVKSVSNVCYGHCWSWFTGLTKTT
jgi:hypothetical protein